MRLRCVFYTIVILLFSMIHTQLNAQSKPTAILLQLKYGDVIIELYPDKAPQHVDRMIKFSEQHFYDGLSFHRVIADFIAQTGDPKEDGTGGSKEPNLKAEFNDIKHVRGVVSMARSNNPDSANSQFFIMLADAPHLDGQYTAFGKVISGMEFVDMIKKGNPNNGGIVIDPDKIIKMSVTEHP